MKDVVFILLWGGASLLEKKKKVLSLPRRLFVCLRLPCIQLIKFFRLLVFKLECFKDKRKVLWVFASEMNAHNTRFVCVRDLGHHVDRKVNVLGVVLEFSLPRKSKGTGIFAFSFFFYVFAFFFLWFQVM